MAACLCGGKVGQPNVERFERAATGVWTPRGRGRNWVKGEGSGRGSNDASRISAGRAMAWRRRETRRFEIGPPVVVMTCRIERGRLAMRRRRRHGA